TGSYQAFSGVMPAQEYLDVSSSGGSGGLGDGSEGEPAFGGTGLGTGSGTGSGMGTGFAGNNLPTIEEISFKDDLQIRAQKGEFLPEIIDQVFSRLDPTYEIETINRGIRARANAAGSRPSQSG